MENWNEFVGSVFIIFGSIIIFIGGVGLVRLRDVFERMHGAGLIDTMGIGLIFIGLVFFSGFSFVSVKLVIILVFVLFTSPTATHALAHAALHSGVKPNVDKPSQDLIERALSAERQNTGDNKSKTL